ncbi:SAM-dependent methyltransferase [Amycolatopsis nigrescens]|uniref:SAM-dependent methyltransferase n=1 Tax=Amycolatopsis nigrescens TaxID=381445 RepID=UPI0003738DA4|nr:SAM-dependent methyltransferase [Amycolatopsis nigrescens]
MTQQQDWVPPGIDTTTPSSARTYDCLLGGAHNFQADREAAVQAEKIMPGIRDVARLNRAFLGRVVRSMMAEGVRQFLDIGSGIPTVNNVHQVAERIDPECRVVYVDRDPIAVAHSRLILAANERAAIVHADFHDPDEIFASPEARRLLDLDEPVGVLMVALLHWIPDGDRPTELLAEYRRRVPVGSYLAISHLSSDQRAERIDSAVGMFNRAKGRDQATTRTYDEVEAMFGDFELIEPGLVGCALWRPGGPGDISDDPDANAQIYGGVAKKTR